SLGQRHLDVRDRDADAGADIRHQRAIHNGAEAIERLDQEDVVAVSELEPIEGTVRYAVGGGLLMRVVDGEAPARARLQPVGAAHAPVGRQVEGGAVPVDGAGLVGDTRVPELYVRAEVPVRPAKDAELHLVGLRRQREQAIPGDRQGSSPQATAHVSTSLRTLRTGAPAPRNANTASNVG